MIYVLIPVVFAAGVWAERAFELSAVVVDLWNKWRAGRRFP